MWQTDDMTDVDNDRLTRGPVWGWLSERRQYVSVQFVVERLHDLQRVTDHNTFVY